MYKSFEGDFLEKKYNQWQKYCSLACFEPLLLENGNRYDKKALYQVNR